MAKPVYKLMTDKQLIGIGSYIMIIKILCYVVANVFALKFIFL